MSIFVKAVIAILISTVPASTPTEVEPSPTPVVAMTEVVSRQVAEPAPVPPVGIVAPNATAAQLDRLDAAVETFTDAGLELPAIEVNFHDTNAPCKGHAGLYRAATEAHLRDTITICDTMPFYLLHELAHAWEHHAIGDDHRAHLTEEWDLPTWGSHDFAWADRGIEQAAETVAFTLSRTQPTDSAKITGYGCDFERLTGKALPQPEFFNCA